MLCRFENRLTGEAIELKKFNHRIAVTSASGLDAAFRDIADAQARGYWVALLLDYELGEWLEPSSVGSVGVDVLPEANARPRLTALVYREAEHVPVWQKSDTAQPPGATSEPAGATPAALTAVCTHKPLGARAQAPDSDLADAQAPLLSATALLPRSRYLGHIEALRTSIARGEIYQANYTFPIAVESGVSPLMLYREIARQHPSGHAAYVEDEGRTLLSFSPELFFARSGSTLTVRPMKGTAPRFADSEQDIQSGQQLLHSEKNRAENLMIVDLLRNDLGRVATPGTVKVEALFTLEQYPSVWTLTSTVTAKAPDVSLEALLRALFPCGSITGAPKIAAMKKIRELEMAERGIYCGSIGWLAPNGDCSLNVAIRTITMQGGAPEDAQAGLSDHAASFAEQDQNANVPDSKENFAGKREQIIAGYRSASPRFHGVFGVGGGIVFDSAPEQEWQECLWKARILGTPLGCVDDMPAADPRQGKLRDTVKHPVAGRPIRSSHSSSESRVKAKRRP